MSSPELMEILGFWFWGPNYTPLVEGYWEWHGSGHMFPVPVVPFMRRGWGRIYEDDGGFVYEIIFGTEDSLG